MLLAMLLFSGCGRNAADAGNTEHIHSESCTGHDHDSDHSTHDHSSHNHADPSDHGECDHDHSGHDHGTPAVDSHEDAIVLNAAQSDALGLTYEVARPAPFAEITAVSGIIESAPGDRATLTATVSGIVSFAGRGLTVGQQVQKGASVLQLSSAVLADGNLPQQLADARAEAARARTEAARAEELAKSRMIIASELEAARLALELAERRVSVLSRNATSGGRSITAPINGYITSLLVGEGDYVEAGQPLATLAANYRLVLRADIPQRYLSRLSTIRSARFTTPYDGVSHDLQELNGRLIGTGKEIATGGPTLPVRFEFDNRDGFIPGTVIETYLLGNERSSVLTVPVGSLTEEQGAFFVYVRTSPEHYEKKAVRIGATDGARVEILAGLRSGDEVVASGGYFVRLASLSGEIPHGHAH